MQLTIDPDQWTKEQCEIVQLYLERHLNVFQRCRCDNGTFYDVIFNCYPTAAWKYMQRELALSEKSEQCPRRLLYFGAAIAGIEIALSRMR